MILSNSEFKRLIQKGARPAAACLRKDMSSVPQTAGDRQLRFVVSTACVDRDGDVIDQSGWQLDAYRKNPVVLLGHDQASLPIGKATEIDVVGGQLVATVQFVPSSVPVAGPMADAVYELCRCGYLSATSVGFSPVDFEVSDDPERSKGGVYPGLDHKVQSLLEFSIVTVPSNYEALLDQASIPSDPSTIDDAAQSSTTVRASHQSDAAKAKRARGLVVAQLA